MIDLITSANERIEALKCPLQTLATLSNIPLSEISRILARKIVSNERTLKIDAALKSIESLSEMCEPLPLNLRDGQKLKWVLGQIESGNTKIIVMADLIGE